MIATCRTSVRCGTIATAARLAQGVHHDSDSRPLPVSAPRKRAMTYVESALLAVGMTRLVAGYRRSRRGWLATTAIVLFLAGAIEPFAHGFSEGLQMGWASVGH
jgi:hypothetical protein